MSSRKNNIKQFQIVTSGDMSQSSVTSLVTDIQFLDNIAIQINFTGSPVGSFAIQTSLDYAIDNVTNTVINTGNWVDYQGLSISTAVGSPIIIELNQVSSPFIRLVYSKVSGSGTMNAYISAKTI
jgi:hypothetical protein